MTHAKAEEPMQQVAELVSQLELEDRELLAGLDDLSDEDLGSVLLLRRGTQDLFVGLEILEADPPDAARPERLGLTPFGREVVARSAAQSPRPTEFLSDEEFRAQMLGPDGGPEAASAGVSADKGVAAASS